jgi:hypothetical protein
VVGVLALDDVEVRDEEVRRRAFEAHYPSLVVGLECVDHAAQVVEELRTATFSGGLLITAR